MGSSITSQWNEYINSFSFLSDTTLQNVSRDIKFTYAETFTNGTLTNLTFFILNHSFLFFSLYNHLLVVIYCLSIVIIYLHAISIVHLFLKEI
jgi:hypothetical protein